MPIKKQFIKTKLVCKVTFTISAKEANTVAVVGDFNNWTAGDGVLTKQKNGTFKGLFEIPKESSYEFKYVVDGAFVNEPDADGLIWNDFAGSENSVLAL